MRAGWRAAGCYVFANAASLSVGYPDTSYDEYGKRPHTPALSTTTSQLRKGEKNLKLVILSQEVQAQAGSYSALFP